MSQTVFTIFNIKSFCIVRLYIYCTKIVGYASTLLSFMIIKCSSHYLFEFIMEYRCDSTVMATPEDIYSSFFGKHINKQPNL